MIVNLVFRAIIKSEVIKMKKKYGLIKVLAVLLFLVVIATYFIKGRGGEIKYLALVDVFFNFTQSFYYFFDTALFILAVGGFYGFLNRIPAYKELINRIASKVENNSKRFLIITIIVMALISAFSGLNFLLLVFVPFLVSIILILGYDKLVALSVTLGSILIGFIGGIFITFKDGSSQYSISYTTFEKLVGLKNDWDISVILPKCLLLLIGIVLLITYISGHLKDDKKSKYNLTKNDPLLVELKEKDNKNEHKGNVKVWPLVLILLVMIVLFTLGYIPWNDLFGIKVFDDFHTWLTGLSVGNYKVFTSLISSSITAFGKWGNLGNFMMMIFVMFFAEFILLLIYRIKFDDAVDGMIYGIKKMIPAAVISMLAYAVLVSSYNNGFVETIITETTKSFGDNVIAHSLVSLLGSILNVDLYYVTSGIFSSIVSALSEKANLSVFAVMFQSLYGLVQLIGPTSLFLIVGLSYLEVPYKTWIKYIWRLIVELLIAIIIILMVVTLL